MYWVDLSHFQHFGRDCIVGTDVEMFDSVHRRGLLAFWSFRDKSAHVASCVHGASPQQGLFRRLKEWTGTVMARCYCFFGLPCLEAPLTEVVSIA